MLKQLHYPDPLTSKAFYTAIGDQQVEIRSPVETTLAACQKKEDCDAFCLDGRGTFKINEKLNDNLTNY
jgi:hypothetical protein